MKLKSKTSLRDTAVEMAIMVVASTVVLYLCYTLLSTCLSYFDNDTYWIVATGREIFKQKALPEFNPVTIHENLPFIVHQWLYTVVVTFLHDNVGKWSLLVLNICLLISSVIIAYIYSKEFTENKTTRILAVVTYFYCSCSYFISRPSSFSIPIFLFMILCWTKSRQNKKWLIPIPLLSILTVNLHTSMWFMLPVLSLPFIMPEELPVGVSAKGYLKNWFTSKRLHLAVFALSFVCGILNPYGLTGMFYPLLSYGTVNSSYILELQSSRIYSADALVIIITVILFVYCCVKTYKNKKLDDKLNLNYFFLYAGCLFLAVKHVRNLWMCGIASIPFVAYWLNNIRFKKFDKKILKEAKIFTAIFISMFILLSLSAPEFLVDKKRIIDLPVEIMDYIDDNNDENTKIFAGFNVGGYVEYRGYKTYIDARPEIYSKCINKTEDIFIEYIAVTNGLVDYKEWLDKYGFTYLIVSVPETPLRVYLQCSDEYTEIMKEKGLYLFARTET